MTTITVVKIGVSHLWAGDIPEPVFTQLRLANDLWNSMVESHRLHEAAKAEIWSSYPGVAAAETAVAEIEQRISTYAEKVAEERIRQRSKRPNHPAVGQLADARKELRAAKAVRRTAISAVREDAKTRLTAALADRYERERDLRRAHSAAGGHWATANDVQRRRFATALKRVSDLRAAGRPADLRTHRFDRTGTITVQLQRQDGDPPRTPQAISDGTTKWRNTLILPRIEGWDDMTPPQRREAGRVTVKFYLGSSTWAEIPVQLHRQLPPDADIAEARLTIRRVGPDYRAALTVVAKIPDPEPVRSGPEVALHLGWLDNPDGGIQTAVWRSTAPLDIPPHLKHVMITDPGGDTGRIVVPPEIGRRLAVLDETRSIRDRALNRIFAYLIDWVTDHGPLPSPWPDITVIDTDELKEWKRGRRNPARGKLHRLAWHLVGNPETRDTEPARQLLTYAKGDMRRWRAEHGRQAALGCRDDLYRQIGAVFARQAGRLIVDDSSIADLARTGRDDASGIPPEALAAAARRRVIGAPGMLRAFTVQACTRDGVPTPTVPAKNLSAEHTCGRINTVSARPIQCAGCGRSYDPDTSATMIMLRRARTLQQATP